MKKDKSKAKASGRPNRTLSKNILRASFRQLKHGQEKEATSASEISPEVLRTILRMGRRQQAEIESLEMQQKEDAINAAEKVIYSAVSGWISEKTTSGMPLPVYRNGQKIGQLDYDRILGHQEVNRILDGAKVKSLRELDETLGRLEELAQAALSLMSALTSLSDTELGKLDATIDLHFEPDNRDIKIIRAISSTRTAFLSTAEVARGIEYQKQSIRGQLKEVKIGRGRPRNEAAHSVALHLAKLYAILTGRRPTYSEGQNGLSGEYTPALRNVFDALGWNETSLRTPAEAAIAGIYDSDIMIPHQSNFTPDDE